MYINLSDFEGKKRRNYVLNENVYFYMCFQKSLPFSHGSSVFRGPEAKKVRNTCLVFLFFVSLLRLVFRSTFVGKRHVLS